MKENILIVAPIGGFMNHLRWLLWLDPKTPGTIEPRRIDQDRYNSIKGQDWPHHRIIHFKRWNQVPEHLHKELRSFHIFPDIVEDRKQFVLDNVYPDDRTWHNWLNFETAWRRRISKDIHVSHKVLQGYRRTIALKMNPQHALSAYYKLNQTLNGLTPDVFLDNVRDCNKSIDLLDQGVLHLRSEDLFTPVLDRNFYNSVIEFLDFDDYYVDANEIHQQWYKLHKKAEEEFKNEGKHRSLR